MSGKTSLTSWRANCVETVWGTFTSWFGTYCIYICCFFKSDASPKKLFVFIIMFYFLSGCDRISGKYYKDSVFLGIFRYLDKI